MSFLPTAVELGRRAALAMLASLLLCYALAATGLMGWPVLVAFAIFLVSALLALPAVCDLRVSPLVLVACALVLIALGSPVTAGTRGRSGCSMPSASSWRARCMPSWTTTRRGATTTIRRWYRC